MKLNKILALALSGVMAVSMLAGCSGASSNGDEGENQGTVDTSVVASTLNDEQKDNDVKVNFTYSSTLQSALEKTLSVVGGDANAKTTETYLVKVLGVEDVVMSHFYGRSNQDSGTANKVGTQTAVVVLRDDSGKTDKGVAKDLYSKLSNDMKLLTADWTNNNVKWSFSYTGEVAKVSGVEGTKNYTYIVAVVTCNTTKALAD